MYIDKIEYSNTTYQNDTVNITVSSGAPSNLKWYYRVRPIDNETWQEIKVLYQSFYTEDDKKTYVLTDQELKTIASINSNINIIQHQFTLEEIPIGYEYQIGCGISNPTEWYGGDAEDYVKSIYYAFDSLSTPTLYNGYVLTGEFKNFYRDGQLRFKWHSIPVPTGLTYYYYQIQYQFDGEVEWKNYDNIGIVNESIDNEVSINSANFAINSKIKFRFKIFGRLNDIPIISNPTIDSQIMQKVGASNYFVTGDVSNIKYKVLIDGADKRTDVIRPNYINVGLDALRINISSPSFPVKRDGTAERYNWGFKYKIYYKNGTKEKVILNGNVTENTTTTAEYIVPYSVLAPYYDDFGVASVRNSVYNFKIKFEYIDGLTNILSSEIDVKIDFREPPLAPSEVRFGRDGVISNLPAQVALLKTNETNFFPTPSPNFKNPVDYPGNVILPGEHFIVAFREPAKAYPAQYQKYTVIIRQLGTDFTGQINEKIWSKYPSVYSNTFFREDTKLVVGSNYNITDENDFLCYPIAVSDLNETFKSLNYYAVSVVAHDTISYEGDKSDTKVCTTYYLAGLPRQKPSILLLEPNVTGPIDNKYTTSFDSKYTISWNETNNPHARVYQRILKYQNINYTPTSNQEAILYTRVSKTSNFAQYDQTVKKYTDSTDKKYYEESLKDLSITVNNIEGATATKLYSMMRLEYVTGLTLIQNEDKSYSIVTTSDYVESNSTLNYVKVASISQRQHSMGINDPDLKGMEDDYLFSIKQYDTKNLIRFFGTHEEVGKNPYDIELEYNTGNAIFRTLVSDPQTPAEQSEVFRLNTLDPLVHDDQIQAIFDRGWNS